MPWQKWNGKMGCYEVKDDAASDLFDDIESRYAEYYGQSSRSTKGYVTRDIKPYTKAQLKEIARDDRRHNVTSESVRNDSGRKFCAFCGKETTKQKYERVFCSHGCRSNMQHWRKQQKMALCTVCGEVFTPKYKKHATKTYACSPECKKILGSMHGKKGGRGNRAAFKEENAWEDSRAD